MSSKPFVFFVFRFLVLLVTSVLFIGRVIEFVCIVYLKTSIAFDVLQTGRVASADPPQDRVHLLLVERRTTGNEVVHKRPASFK